MEKYEGLFCCLHLQLMTEEESTFLAGLFSNTARAVVVAAGKQIPLYEIQWLKWVNKPAIAAAARMITSMNPLPYLTTIVMRSLFPAFYVANFPIKNIPCDNNLHYYMSI